MLTDEIARRRQVGHPAESIDATTLRPQVSWGTNPGMTWQLIYQDLKPANLLISAQDRVTVLDLGGCQLINLDTGDVIEFRSEEIEAQSGIPFHREVGMLRLDLAHQLDPVHPYFGEVLDDGRDVPILRDVVGDRNGGRL